METKCATPTNRNRTVLAAAIAIVLCGPVHAADPKPTMSQYDSAVTYADYRDQKGGYKLRASDLIGRNIENSNNDEIGEIDDLIVSRDGDKVLAVISLGSFFDLDTKLVAIPYEDLRVTRDGKHLYYNASRKELQERSEFVYADWEYRVTDKTRNEKRAASDGQQSNLVAAADVNSSTDDTGHVSENRKSAGSNMPADNTARNAADAAGADLTPLDQSHAEADVDITRAIRKVLVDDETLGTNAQNVKVITVDGMVTLRGAVASADEQARIVAIAQNAAGMDRVLNELQVIKR